MGLLYIKYYSLCLFGFKFLRLFIIPEKINNNIYVLVK